MAYLLPLESLELVRQPRAGGVPVRRREQHGHGFAHCRIGDLQGQVREQVERRAVGPVEIVDDDEERGVCSQPDRGRGDGNEHARLLLFLGSRPGTGRALRALAEQPLDDGRVPGERRVLAGEELQPGEKRRGERQVRKIEMLAAPARGHLHAEAGSRALHLAHEPRLPDSGLAGEQDQLRLTAPGVVEALLEPLALVVSIDERANARRLLPDHRNPQLPRASPEG